MEPGETFTEALSVDTCMVYQCTFVKKNFKGKKKYITIAMASIIAISYNWSDVRGVVGN